MYIATWASSEGPTPKKIRSPGRAAATEAGLRSEPSRKVDSDTWVPRSAMPAMVPVCQACPLRWSTPLPKAVQKIQEMKEWASA